MGSARRGKHKRHSEERVFISLAAILGLIIALFISVLLTFPLSKLPDPWGNISPIAASIFLCLIITPLTVSQRVEILRILGISAASRLTAKSGPYNGRLLVDTSALIDGRIADIIQAGFIPGPLVIPRFVLNELQHIADSYEPVRRNRGRRGLDILTRLQQELSNALEISDMDAKGIAEVDSKLVELAKSYNFAILTNDFNLNQVAKIQGVRVLNVNELANAVRPVVLPGEEMNVQIIQEGKELGQGIGFLDDGTMIVVEDGRRYINNKVEVVVTRVLQTSAGRMIFAQPKAGE
jgi:uncharacterized protein YacL